MVDGRKAVRGDTLIGRQIEEKEGNESEMLFVQRERIICPVCGKEIDEVNFPDAKSLVEDSLFLAGLVVVDSSVCFLIDIEHWYEKAEITLENPHELTAVVTCEFDSQGECIHFEIKGVLAGR